MTDGTEWKWDSFLGELLPHLERFSGDWGEIFDILSGAEAVWRGIVEREAGIESERPQDFVAAILATQSFRIAVSDLILQLSGYSDEAVGLDRTLEDIWLRLSVISRDPEKAALGFYNAYVDLEIEVTRMSISRAGDDAPALKEGFEENLRRLEDYRRKVKDLIRDRGYDPAELKKSYGRMRTAQAARSIHPEVAKRHKYRSAAQGAYIHARGFGVDRFILSYSPQRVYSIGPIYDLLNIMRIRETIAQLLENLRLAASLSGLEGADEAVSSALAGLEPAFASVVARASGK